MVKTQHKNYRELFRDQQEENSPESSPEKDESPRKGEPVEGHAKKVTGERKLKDEDAKCQICNSGDYEEEDLIVFCGVSISERPSSAAASPCTKTATASARSPSTNGSASTVASLGRARASASSAASARGWAAQCAQRTC